MDTPLQTDEETEGRSARRQAQKLERLAVLTASIAHDVNNLLAVLGATSAATGAVRQQGQSHKPTTDKPRLSPQGLLDELHRRAAAASDERCRTMRFARPEPANPSHASFGANWTCRHFAYLPRGCEEIGLNILVLAMTEFDCDWSAGPT